MEKRGSIFQVSSIFTNSSNVRMPDDRVLDNIVNAQDRRNSWQTQHTQKSFMPSLSIVCKLISSF